MKFLYAAYGVTWAVILLYLFSLTRAFQRLRDEVRELEEK